jgi:hypothetical protein
MTLPILLLSAGLLGAEPATPAEPEAKPAAAAMEKPAVKDLGDGKFSMGEITFNQKDRSISFPARVNMIDGLLEYAIVHQSGKIHESLLVTDISPLHLNVALKLLRYQASEELFPILDENWKPTSEYPQVSDEVKAAARVEILLSWKKEDGGMGEASLNDWIYHTVTETTIPAAPWIYGGSYVHEGVFQAQSTGDIGAIFTANSALFNYPGKDRDLDTVWIPTPKRVPPVGTPVTVTIKPVLRL